jgi:hypothetical protein
MTLGMRANYALMLCMHTGGTLDDLREAVKTFEDTERIARRVFGASHPTTVKVDKYLRDARTLLRARETPGS